MASKMGFATRLRNAATFTFYTGLVAGGVGLSGIVVYYFVHDVLLPTSDVAIFTKARKLIEKDPECQRILGADKLKAYGEPTGSKWARNRPIASRRGFDAAGREHLLMQFHVKGPLEEGLVRLEMIESKDSKDSMIGKFDFRYLALETKSHSRVYVIDNSPRITPTQNNKGFLGVKWGKH